MAALEAGTPAAVQFWYRSSPRPIATINPMALTPSRDDPPSTLSGMVSIVLDSIGRVQEFHVVPPQAETATPSPSEVVAWTHFFTAAGLDHSSFSPVTPEWVPPVYADARHAWTGTSAGAPDVPIRVEAAAHRGRPVDFVVLRPWSRYPRVTTSPAGGAGILLYTVGGFVFIAVFLTAGLLARRNLTLGRGDRRCAARLAMVIIGASIAGWAVGSDHVQDPAEITRFLFGGVARSLYSGGYSWLFYLAAEPEVRRVWPQALVTWTRVARGSLRDPMVGRDLLVGTAYGVLMTLVACALWMVPHVLGLAAFQPHVSSLVPTYGVRSFGFYILRQSVTALSNGLVIVFVMTMFLVVFRRKALAFVAGLLVMTVVGAAGTSNNSAPVQGLKVDRTHGFSRRGFIHTAAGATALALGPDLSSSALAHDDDHQTRPAPKPIPGGSDLSGFGLVPPYDFIHTFGPGQAGIVLPFTGVALQGLNVEPGTITDFHGATAVAYHVGKAKGSDGNTYNLETDIRVMDGIDVAVDGTTPRGSFALI